MRKDRFGLELLDFAESLKVVDESMLGHIWVEIGQYLQDSFSFRELMCIHSTRSGPVLKTMRWTSHGKPDRYDMLKKIDGQGTAIHGVNAYACLHGQPIWIVACNNKTLAGRPLGGRLSSRQSADGSDHQSADLWSDCKDVPPYFPAPGQDMACTSVVIPLAEMEHVLGVVNFESSEHIEPTDILKDEMHLIGRALTIVLSLYLGSQRQYEEISRVVRLAEGYSIRQIKGKPRVFLGCPARNKCSTDVFDAITRVFLALADECELVAWHSKDAPGDIPSQIAADIDTCEFGVFYFSEIIKPARSSRNGQQKTSGRQRREQLNFSDNVNVMFESGMMQASHRRSGKSSVLIREENSGEPPFDISNQRIISPQRNGTELDHDAFEGTLTRAIREMLRQVETERRHGHAISEH